MRHAYDKTLDIAAQLMASQLEGQGIGNAADAQDKGEYFLKLAETIGEGIARMPD